MSAKTFIEHTEAGTTMVATLDNEHPWFEAHGMYEGKHPLTYLVTGPTENGVRQWIAHTNAVDQSWADLRGGAVPTKHFSDLQPVTLENVAAKLREGFQYSGIMCGVTKGGATNGPITPNLRQYLLAEGDPKP